MSVDRVSEERDGVEQKSGDAGNHRLRSYVSRACMLSNARSRRTQTLKVDVKSAIQPDLSRQKWFVRSGLGTTPVTSSLMP